jgi:hypothetical protein
VSTHGILFAGTPHQGSEMVSWGRRLADIASIFINTNTALLTHLASDSEFLQSQLSQYLNISDQFVTKFAFETLATRLRTGNEIVVVPRSSAVVPTRDAAVIAIHTNHSNMVKASSAEDGNYLSLSGHLAVMARGAVSRVAAKWRIEQRATGRNGIFPSCSMFETKIC